MSIIYLGAWTASRATNPEATGNIVSAQINTNKNIFYILPFTGMQNLSISCALVCLIILGSAALVGTFGLCQHQISAVLVTGVMYLLAASFALFTLTIIHFKRLHGKPYVDIEFDGTVDGVVSPTGSRGITELLAARVFNTSWSLDLGWGGVMLCVMTSVLWILLSKIMRFNPISSMIN